MHLYLKLKKIELFIKTVYNKFIFEGPDSVMKTEKSSKGSWGHGN